MQKHGIWFKNFVEEQDANWQTEAIRTAFLGWCTVQIVANAFPIQAHSHSTDQMEKPMMQTVVSLPHLQVHVWRMHHALYQIFHSGQAG